MMKYILYAVAKLSIVLSMSFLNALETEDFTVPCIVAHRGFSARYPENTIPAFKNSVGVADYVELDVRLTKDDVPVVMHDETTDRVADNKGKVRNLTLKELKEDFTLRHIYHNGRLYKNINFIVEVSLLLAQGLDKSNKYDEKIPSLEEVFQSMKDEKIGFFIELKGQKKDTDLLSKKCVDLVKKYGLQDRVIFISFSEAILRTVHKVDPTLKVSLVISERGIKKEKVFEDVSTFLRQNNGVAALLPAKGFPRNISKKFQEAGFKVGAWIPNSTKEIQAVIRNKVDFIITNHPDKAKNLANLARR